MRISDAVLQAIIGSAGLGIVAWISGRVARNAKRIDSTQAAIGELSKKQEVFTDDLTGQLKERNAEIHTLKEDHRAELEVLHTRLETKRIKIEAQCEKIFALQELLAHCKQREIEAERNGGVIGAVEVETKQREEYKP